MNVLIKPVITEKANTQSESHSRYSFLVDFKANKIEIKNAVENAYGVKVEKVRTMNYSPERKIRYTKNGIQEGKAGAFKKAVVQIAEGETIDFYSSI
jgi:large subunit ribosomal protein L23